MDPRRRRVSEIMRREVATLAPGDALDLGDDLMNLGRVRHLPVLEGERLVGMVSHRDVLSASLSRALDFEPAARRSFLRSVGVEEVMSKALVTVTPETSLAEAAERLIGRQIGALPVVEEGDRLVGLVTETDLLAAAYGLGGAGDEEAIDVANEFSKWLEEELDDVRRARDELRVQVHLAKAEVRDRWEEAEKTLGALEQRAKRTARAAEEPLQQLKADTRKLLADLRDGYDRIRASL